MSERSASCPGCGATLVFQNAASLFVVCPHCGGASQRLDVGLESIGRVAQVGPIASVLSLGAEGVLVENGRRWRAVGQVQLDHGAGPWNEWALAFDDGVDGSWAWLAEAQGELLVTWPVEAEGVPAPQGLEAGASIDLSPHGRFVVAEVGAARVVAARGELPIRAVPGTTYAYADLRGVAGAFATISAGARAKAPDLYLGRPVPVEALGIDAATVTPVEATRVQAARLSCPSCGDTVDVRDPGNSQRVVCAGCRSVLDPGSRQARVVGAAQKLRLEPRLPIGSVAVLRGERVEVLGFLVRSVKEEDEIYRWREHLLRTSKGAYRWLVENDGHWSYGRPVGIGEVTDAGGRTRRYEGDEFRFFQAGRARVDAVLGEVYWAVEVGEEARLHDYVAPPRMLSTEGTGKEQLATLLEYVPRREVAEAFGVELPPESGIAPNQPNPYAATGLGATFLLLASAVLALWIFFFVHHDRRRVFELRGHASQTPATPAFFSEEIALAPDGANLEVELAADLVNGWIGFDGSLVDLERGDVRAFELDAERWTEAGESEGSGRGSVRVGRVPAGRYGLRFAPVVQSAAPVPFTLTARSQVPSGWRPWVVIALLSSVPLVAWFLRSRFESRRWETSSSGDETWLGRLRGGLSSGDDE